MTKACIVALSTAAVLRANAQPPGVSDPRPTIALVGGTVIDGLGNSPISHGTIVIRDGTIVVVGPSNRVSIPPGARRMDMTGRFIVPGFVDANVPHILGEVFLSGVEGLVEEGMTPLQALTAATQNGALAAGRESRIGTITVGRQADLVILTADPLADIHNIRRLAFVVHRGQIVEVH